MTKNQLSDHNQSANGTDNIFKNVKTFETSQPKLD